MSRSALEELRHHCQGLSGIQVDSSHLISLLKQCWDEFSGDSSVLTAFKLDRAEHVKVNALELSFTLERHGGIKYGSTRAELQHWTVDLQEVTAHCEKTGFRQLKPRRASFDAGAAAREVASLIALRKPDARVQWKNDTTLIIKIGEIVSESLPKQTRAGQRKRFRAELTKEMLLMRYREVRANCYELDDSKKVET